MLVSIALAAVASTRAVSTGTVAAIFVLGVLAAVATYMDVDVDAAIGLSGNTMILDCCDGRLPTGSFLPRCRARGGTWRHRLHAGAKPRVLQDGNQRWRGLLGAPCRLPLRFGRSHRNQSRRNCVLAAGAALGAGVYYLVHCILLSVPLAIDRGESIPSNVAAASCHRPARPTHSLSFGLGVGWAYIHLGAAVVPLFAVPIFVARANVCELCRVEGGAGADDRDLDPCSRGEGSVHGGPCAARGDVRGVRG